MFAGPELPGGWCQTYVTGSKGVFSLGEWEKCLTSVSGRLSVGLIRCTGKYNNISFRIKTPFLRWLTIFFGFAEVKKLSVSLDKAYGSMLAAVFSF